MPRPLAEAIEPLLRDKMHPLMKWRGTITAGARDQFAALLQVREGVFGPEHPRTLNVRTSLAYWVRRADDAGDN